MDIEKLFGYLSNNKKLILYLFEHRDRVVSRDEVEEFTQSTIENLAFYEIVELIDDKIALDLRVTAFLEEYIDSNEMIDIAIIGSILQELEYTILNAKEFPNKQHIFIPKIRRYIFKIDNILFKNLDKLRGHIYRVYKNTDEFKLKLKELHFYKQRLEEFDEALQNFDAFFLKYTELLRKFANDDLDKVVLLVKSNKIELFRTLIPLTQEVISYINKLEVKNLFIDKVIKLKELKDSYELNTKTNIQDMASSFDMYIQPLKISTKLDREILYSTEFEKLLLKHTAKKQLKNHIALSIDTTQESIKQNSLLNIDLLHRHFNATNLSLIEFLIGLYDMRDKSIEEISQIYCKMILMYDDEYNLTDEKIMIQNINFAKVYHK